MVPIWLLDVDGVLNAVTYEPDPAAWPDWRRGWAEAAGRSWPITYSPAVVRCVTEMHTAGHADVRWLTTWRTAANGSLRELLGLPELPVEGLVRPAEPSPSALDEAAASHGAWTGGAAPADDWWKLSAVRALVAAEGAARPLVWTDDDLAYRDDAVEWVRRNVDRSLLLAPDAATGLTAADLDRIRAFAAG